MPHNFRILVSVLMAVIAVVINKYDWGQNFLFYRHAMILSFFLAFGDLIKRHITKRLNLPILIAETFTFLFICVGYYLTNHLVPPRITMDFNVDITTLPLHWIISILGSIVILKLAQIINKSSFLEYLGRESLTIYIWHFFFIMIIDKILKDQINENQSIAISFVLFVIVFLGALAGSLFTARILDFKYLKWIKGK